MHKTLTQPLFCALLSAAVVLPTAWPTAAHAGWFNDLFTFNEDQKRPFNPLPTQVPPPDFYYDARYGDDWAEFYQGATVQPYMNGSASMVERKPASTAEKPSNLGDDVFARRHYLNQNPGNNQVVITEPGDNPWVNPNMVAQAPGWGPGGAAGMAAQMGHMAPNTQIALADNPDLRARTYIGHPKDHWRSGPKDPVMAPRPGDFDYQARDTMAAAQAPAGQGQGGSDMAPVTAAPTMGGKYQGDGSTSYNVVRGDTLSEISDKPQIYDDWTLWPLLYDANKLVIGRDPDLIQPGQQLAVPRDVTADQAAAATQRAKRKRPPHLLNDGR
mgnify:CR=1 FL=1